MSKRSFGAACAVVLLSTAAAAAASDPVLLVRPAPALDRWMYPFNEAVPSGSRTTMPTYWPVRDSRFDDRDAEVLLGFDLAPDVPAGFRPGNYRVLSARVTAQVQTPSAEETFVYDPTVDPVASYLAPTDPAFVADADAGRPVELFAVAYRGSLAGVPWSAATYGENSPFSTVAPVPPALWRNTRAVYPVSFDASGAAVDASNNVTRPAAQGGPFQPVAMAVGATGAAAPGEAVPDGAVFVFEFDVAPAGHQGYLRAAAARGRLNVVLSSLHDAVEFGGGPAHYPRWVSKENTLAGAQPARLEMSVRVCIADLATAGSSDEQAGPDGFVTGDDFDLFIRAFFDEAVDAQTGRKIADVATAGSGATGPDGFLTGEDFDAFVRVFFEGCE